MSIVRGNSAITKNLNSKRIPKRNPLSSNITDDGIERQYE
jgi:hypothetical protein